MDSLQYDLVRRTSRICAAGFLSGLLSFLPILAQLKFNVSAFDVLYIGICVAAILLGAVSYVVCFWESGAAIADSAYSSIADIERGYNAAHLKNKLRVLWTYWYCAGAIIVLAVYGLFAA